MVVFRWSRRHNRPAAVGRGDITSFDYQTGKVAPFPQVVRDAINSVQSDNNLYLLDEYEGPTAEV